jgi:hypothetical protein
MVQEVIKGTAESLAQDLYRHLSQVALAQLAESLRKEEPTGKLSTSTLYFLDEIEFRVSEDKAYDN